MQHMPRDTLPILVGLAVVVLIVAALVSMH
jgi:hypothetical protein